MDDWQRDKQRRMDVAKSLGLIPVDATAENTVVTEPVVDDVTGETLYGVGIWHFFEPVEE